jgi:hypothetical protein
MATALAAARWWSRCCSDTTLLSHRDDDGWNNSSDVGHHHESRTSRSDRQDNADGNGGIVWYCCRFLIIDFWKKLSKFASRHPYDPVNVSIYGKWISAALPVRPGYVL